MTAPLTDAERAILLTPCACGHSPNEHGEMLGCWRARRTAVSAR